MRFFFIFLLALSFGYGEEYRYNLSIMALFQNEGPYLREWIEYHRLLGVEHFYLYDHKSQDNPKEILEPYIESGVVDYIDFPKEGYPQNEAIEDVLERVRGETKWLAVIDIDEFFLPKKHFGLNEFLLDYEEYAGVSVNWQCFGTSYVPFIPEGELMIEHLIRRADSSFEWNEHVKCFLRPERVKGVRNTHSFNYERPFYAVRPDKTKQPYGQVSPVQTDVIVLNHYWTRDEAFFNAVKVPRCKEIKGWSRRKTEASNTLMNEVEDRLIVEKYAELLRKRLF